jgi:hypothetical protein
LIKNQHFTERFVIPEKPPCFKPTLLAAHRLDVVFVLLQMQEEAEMSIAIFFQAVVRAKYFN